MDTKAKYTWVDANYADFGGSSIMNVKDGKVEVVDFLHLTERGPEVVGSIRQKPRDDTKSDEPDADEESRLERLGEPDADER